MGTRPCGVVMNQSGPTLFTTCLLLPKVTLRPRNIFILCIYVYVLVVTISLFILGTQYILAFLSSAGFLKWPTYTLVGHSKLATLQENHSTVLVFAHQIYVYNI